MVNKLCVYVCCSIMRRNKECKEETPPSSTRLLPLWVASPSSSEPQQQPPPPRPPQQQTQQQTTSSQPSTSTKSSQTANPPWDRTTSTPFGQQHPSKASISEAGGKSYTIAASLSQMKKAIPTGPTPIQQTDYAPCENGGAKFSIDRSMYSGQDIFQYSDVRRTLVGSRNLVR